MPAIRKYFDGNLKGKRIALWGLAFKPNTDDIREAPALYMIRKLLGEGADVATYDPEAMNNAKALIGNQVHLCKTQYETLVEADALVMATKSAEFTHLIHKNFSVLKNKAIFDGRNLFEPAADEKPGYHYVSIGHQVIN